MPLLYHNPSLNQNLTKWNPTTDTFWVNINGTWTDTHVHANLNTIEIFKDGVWYPQYEATPVISDLSHQAIHDWAVNSSNLLGWSWGGNEYSSRQTTDKIVGVQGRTLKVEWKGSQEQSFTVSSKILQDDEVYITLLGINSSSYGAKSWLTPTTSKQGTQALGNAKALNDANGITLTTDSTRLSVIKRIWID